MAIDALLAFARFCLIANSPALMRAAWRLARRSAAAKPLAADSISTSPLRVSTVEPSGIDAAPLSGRNPLAWNGARMPSKPSVVRVGSFTNTSPETTLTTLVSPGFGGTLPGGSASQASPTPSASPSAWSELARPGSCRSRRGRRRRRGRRGGAATGGTTVKATRAGARLSAAP